MYIYDLIDDHEVLLDLTPEEIAFSLLQIANSNLQNGMVHRDRIVSIEKDSARPGVTPYPDCKDKRELQIALMEAMNWLDVHGVLLPSPDSNGKNGWMIISRKGNKILDEKKFDTYVKAAAFPKSMLHDSIADKVWTSLAKGNLDEAVFQSFKEVEVAVRKAGRYKMTDIGTTLMRNAFHKETGRLTDRSQPEAEREALAHLFAGAIGSYKNPHSHRTVTIKDANEAQEMVLLASHLLRIVETRKSPAFQLFQSDV